MDYVYNFLIDINLNLSDTALKQICDRAVQRARLKAPIKTGKLRKSIKYTINGSTIMLYIDTANFETPYYDYVNIAPKKDGSPRKGNNYWINVITEFGNILYANLDSQFKIQIKKEQDEEKRKQAIEIKNAEIKRRKEQNKQLTEALKQLAVIYALQQLGVNNERKER